MHDENLDRLEMGCGATFVVKEVNGRSTGKTCLMYPGAIEVPDEISVPVTHNPTVEVERNPCLFAKMYYRELNYRKF
jgi:hypothetical protein